jgi:hypothetical protein
VAVTNVDQANGNYVPALGLTVIPQNTNATELGNGNTLRCLGPIPLVPLGTTLFELSSSPYLHGPKHFVSDKQRGVDKRKNSLSRQTRHKQRF